MTPDERSLKYTEITNLINDDRAQQKRNAFDTCLDALSPLDAYESRAQVIKAIAGYFEVHV
ncbi:MAG TPA: hypothetical protein VK673_21855 [Chthoniobacterales bacterium]|nr:hypothetical protein [Chthoniobacterales bacterium]